MNAIQFLLLNFIVLSQGFQIPHSQTQTYHLHIANIKGMKQTILLETEPNIDTDLKNSIIMSINNNRSIIIMYTDDYNMAKNLPMTTTDPTIIVMTKTLDRNVINNISYKNISHWSLLYFVVIASDENYKCEDGRLGKDIFTDVENFLKDFWQLYQIARVVVTFPITCPGIYVIYNDKEDSNKDLYNRTATQIFAKDFNESSKLIANSGEKLNRGYPLRAHIFFRFPTAISSCTIGKYYLKLYNLNQSQGFCGLDGLVMNDVVEYLKFNLVTRKDHACDKYGYAMPANRSLFGSLGCIVHGEIDVSFNTRFMVRYTEKPYNFLHHIRQDSLCAVVKRPDLMPLWHYAHNTFSIWIWIFIAAMVTVIGVLTWISELISKQVTGCKPLKIQAYILNSFTSTLCGFSVLRKGNFLILRGISLLGSVIILAMYQGHVNYQFTTSDHYDQIKTLGALYESGLTVYTTLSTKEIMKAINDPEDKLRELYLSQMKIIGSTNVGQVLRDSNTAILERRADAIVEIILNYADEHKRPLLYVVNECFQIFHLSYIARAGFMFKKEIKILIMRLIEAGLPDKYYEWTRDALRLSDSDFNFGLAPRSFAKITLENQRLPFGFLIFGYIVSIAIFIREKWGTKTTGKDNK